MNNFSYIFIDNNSLAEFSKDDRVPLLINFIKKNNLCFIITDVLLIESYNPNPTGIDRTDLICNLLSQIPFIVTSHTLIWKEELKAYPIISENFPYTVCSDIIPTDASLEDKKSVFLYIYRDRLTAAGISLPFVVEKFSEIKNKYLESIDKIIEKALEDGILTIMKDGKINCSQENKCKFLWGMDLRLCEEFKELQKYTCREEVPPELDIYIDKLKLLRINHDSHKMKGLHLTSLAFWYEYIKAKKKREVSDYADFLNLSLIPYCKYAILDKSRVDMMGKILKNENVEYKNVIVLNMNEFSKEIAHHMCV